MNERRYYRNLSLFFSLASLSALTFFFLLFINVILESELPYYGEPNRKLALFSEWIFLVGWLPGSVLAIFSLMTLRRSQGLQQIIPAWIFSILATVVSLLWASLAIFATLVSLFHRTHQI
jgi:hypothetical protein